MTKEELRELVEYYGDAIITFKSANSGKSKYNVVPLFKALGNKTDE